MVMVKVKRSRGEERSLQLVSSGLLNTTKSASCVATQLQPVQRVDIIQVMPPREQQHKMGGEKSEDNSKCKLLVIGAGLGRTGTLSTRSALEHLLGHPCYHGAVPAGEKPEHVLPWIKVFTSGKLEPEMAKDTRLAWMSPSTIGTSS